MAVVVSDTSPLRALAFLNRLDLLAELFGTVLIPPAVAGELEHPPSGLVAVQPRLLPFVTIRAPSDADRVCSLAAELDRGEAEALSLAIEEGITIVLLDEAAGLAVAERLGLTPVGVLGILVRGKQRGRIDAIGPLIDQLMKESRFFVSSELRSEALRRAGE